MLAAKRRSGPKGCRTKDMRKIVILKALGHGFTASGLPLDNGPAASASQRGHGWEPPKKKFVLQQNQCREGENFAGGQFRRR